MISRTLAASAVALSALGFSALATPSRAAPRAVITQNRAALNGIARARRQNNAVIGSVQRNIRADQRRKF